MRPTRAVLPGRRIVLALALSTPFACGPSGPAPAVPTPVASASASASAAPPVAAEAPDPPMPKLRTGVLARVRHAEAAGTVIARSVDDGYETLAVDVVLPLERAFSWSIAQQTVVNLGGEPGRPYAFATMPEDVRTVESRGLAAVTVWIRRPRAEEGKPVTGVLYTPHLDDDPGHEVPFRASAPAAQRPDPKLPARWAAALAGAIRARGSSPWHRFAGERILAAFAGPAKAKAPSRAMGRGARAPRAELDRLMDTTTGVMSIQEALQADRPLFLQTAREKPAIPIAKLVPPASRAHPWDDLLRALGKPAPAEALAASVPAEFYYVRAKDLGVLFQLSDQLDAWATPLVQSLDRAADERELSARYETSLGMARTALARALGKEVVAEVALVGSDPYLREGSDLSVLFRVTRRPLFEAGLAATLATRAGEHGGVATSTVQRQGVDVRIATSADGAVRQHRATVGDLEIVSNSLGAITRILDAAQGKRPRLSDEKDFAYLLARDADVRADALAFMGDRFVGEVVGPRQKVAEARRQIALAELSTPGLAALTYGWLTGHAPATVDDLHAAKLLAKDELKHVGGAAIAWKPGDAPRSVYGTPASLTPLIDLPTPELVTEAERDAYERFSRGYESNWSSYIDPAALRIAVDGAPGAGSLTADLRVVPLIDGTDYREILETAGQARVDVPPLGHGARAVVGIGPTASVRRELSRFAHAFSRQHDLALDFLGDWAMLGCEDRTPIARAYHALERHLPELPADEDARRPDELELAARSPVYAAVGIRSMTGATLALGVLHAIADDVLPGAIAWTERGRERGVAIVRVGVADDRGRRSDDAAAEKPRELELFYALTNGTFLLSLNEPLLRRLIDDALDGHGPGPAASAAAGSQLVLDLSADKGGALATVLSWMLTQETLAASEASRALAEGLLVGVGERAKDPAAARALAVAYLGAVPVPPEGGAFTLGPDGVRDPARGSVSEPAWPAVPVPGSAVDALVSHVGRFRSEVAFDREGPGKGKSALSSLHARVTLGLRGD